MAELCE